MQLVCVTRDCFAYVLGSGKHTLWCHPRLEGPYCGIVPLAGTCERISSSGLEWDLGETVAIGWRFDMVGLSTQITTRFRWAACAARQTQST